MHIPMLELGNLLGAIAIGVGAWIGHRVTKPRDHERAAVLDRIAQGAAALVVRMNPTSSWAVLLQNTVQMIAAAAGLPTKNAGAIERAAASALSTLGKAP